MAKKSKSECQFKGHTGIGIRKQRAHRQQNFADRQSRAPLVFQHVQTNLAIAVYIAVVNARTEDNLHGPKVLGQVSWHNE